MNTRQYLGLIQRYKETIENKLPDIEWLRTIACGTSVSNDNDFIRNSSTGDKIGNMAIKIVEAEAEIKELIEKRDSIIKQIESLEDTALYSVLAKRYISNESNKEISFDLNISERQTRRLLEKAHEEFEKQYGKGYLSIIA